VFGKQSLRLPDDEAWDLTLREFDALTSHWESEREWQAALFAQTPWVLSCIHSTSGDTPELADLMLTQSAARARRRNEEKLARIFGIT